MTLLEVNDPFTAVYKALWDGVLASPEMKLVREGNRISFAYEGEEHDPRPNIADYGSCPQLQLVPDFFNTDLNMDNVQINCQRTWNWIIFTGSKALNKELLPLEYFLLVAMKRARTQILATMFDNYRVIRSFTVERAAQTLPKVDNTKDYPQQMAWYSIWSVVTDLNIMVPNVPDED